MARRTMVSQCPVCDSGMSVSELTCESCGSSLKGRFQVPSLCCLPDDLYQFLLVFIKNRGVIRDVEKELGISYPTVRSRLDAVLEALGFGEQVARSNSNEVIEMLERGEITPEEAEKMLRGESETR